MPDGSVRVVQGEVLSLGHDTQNTVPATKPAQVPDKDQQMGSALRSVYQKTVDEAIPDDLLDLLGKLD
ncbi:MULTISPECIES: NepR family anti-sigma factor [unclassified Sphingomonas]|uniref:NepR family anti-sigma factor n=1 Tax=unclassified Sphingomonas TaxID=196159 RepID=UPI0012E21EB0|nr:MULTISPECIES: NepR family anti-sigma factor [unclassified Sphingomonas]